MLARRRAPGCSWGMIWTGWMTRRHRPSGGEIDTLRKAILLMLSLFVFAIVASPAAARYYAIATIVTNPEADWCQRVEIPVAVGTLSNADWFDLYMTVVDQWTGFGPFPIGTPEDPNRGPFKYWVSLAPVIPFVPLGGSGRFDRFGNECVDGQPRVRGMLGFGTYPDVWGELINQLMEP